METKKDIRIKLLKQVHHNGAFVAPGVILEVPEDIADFYVKRGDAEVADAE